MIINKAKVAIYLDAAHPKKNNECAVSIRITHDRKRKYYPASISLTKKDFEKALTERPGKNLIEAAKQLQAAKLEAQRIIDSIPAFTFEIFEKRFITGRPAGDSVEIWFDKVIEKLTANDQIGTATSYTCAKNSLLSFKPDLKFINISVLFLQQYEKSMLESNRSTTTISIYLRHLRTLFNEAIDDGLIPKELYPFGKKKYQVPESNNTKKAITLQEVGKIFHYNAKPKSTTERAKLYWLFSYFCNGINFKDMALLKYDNIQNNTICFRRAKTVRTKRKIENIEVVMTDEIWSIINKVGNKNKSTETYIFPILTKGLTAARQRQLIQQIIHVVNDHMEIIRKELKIETKLTSYTARHTFSTVLLRKGISTEAISQALGHRDLRTTQNYLKGFDIEKKKELANILNSF